MTVTESKPKERALSAAERLRIARSLPGRATLPEKTAVAGAAALWVVLYMRWRRFRNKKELREKVERIEDVVEKVERIEDVVVNEGDE